jgi:pyruvate dehydrogenase E2 component (dihydrolipoamide acetyltransferase)
MATEVLMPRQGQSVESCLILEWKKNEGDPVKTGDILCEVETDKAAFEVEAPEDGFLIKILHPKGVEVKVLAPIAYIGAKGEKVPGTAAGGSGASAEAARPAGSPDTAAAAPAFSVDAGASKVSAPAAQVFGSPVSGSEGAVKASPRAKNLAEAKGLSLSKPTGTGPEGRIIERDVLNALSGTEPLTPAAAQAAITARLSPPPSGSGAGGRVLQADLSSSSPAAGSPGPFKDIPVKGVRKIIAERMLASLAGHAQLTLSLSADAGTLLDFRKKLKASPEALGISVINISDFVLYAAARRLPSFPELNAHWLGDKIRRFEHVHLGFAVDTPKGLMVPVIRNADSLSLKEISREAKRLAKGCLEGGILPDDLSGGTFTVTNLGAFGIESFTPVLNSPQTAILGVCSIRPKPVMAEDEVRFVPSLGLSLTIDHQAVDGAPAARFLKQLADDLSNFDLVLAM